MTFIGPASRGDDTQNEEQPSTSFGGKAHNRGAAVQGDAPRSLQVMSAVGLARRVNTNARARKQTRVRVEPCAPRLLTRVAPGAGKESHERSGFCGRLAAEPRANGWSAGVDSQWAQRQRAGAGLRNLGNTCYLNSVLQCLTHTPPLANLALQLGHSSTCTFVAPILTSPLARSAACRPRGVGARASRPLTWAVYVGRCTWAGTRRAKHRQTAPLLALPEHPPCSPVRAERRLAESTEFVRLRWRDVQARWARAPSAWWRSICARAWSSRAG